MVPQGRAFGQALHCAREVCRPTPGGRLAVSSRLMSGPDELSAPTLLVAMPQVLDPFFHRSVVLLVHHDEDGSFGFVVNRTAEISLADVLQTMEITGAGKGDVPTWFGGPVQPQIGSVLCRRVASPSETTIEIAPELFLTQDVGDLARLIRQPPADLRLLLGYAGWGEGQLIEEILRNDWIVAPLDLDVIFDPVPESAWERAVLAAGVDPTTLPAWTATVDEEQAN